MVFLQQKFTGVLLSAQKILIHGNLALAVIFILGSLQICLSLKMFQAITAKIDILFI